jgi:hypothetical protein
VAFALPLSALMAVWWREPAAMRQLQVEDIGE